MRFKRIVDSGRLEALLAALNAYSLALEAESWRNPMMCSTWLGSAADERWMAWGVASGKISAQAGDGIATFDGVHSCVLCEPAHIWQCAEPEICGAKFELSCPEFAAKFRR